MKRDYDIIIFGVTSFTGKWLLYEVLKVLEEKSSKKFTWAVASRSVPKMKEILNKVETETGKSLEKIEMIEADVANPDLIREMVKRCQILLNLVGPYTEFGEVVVKACVDEGVHHLDLSAEAIYLAKMEYKYGKVAEENNCFVIGACGMGSVPADSGGEYLAQKFDGYVNSLEVILTPGADNSNFHEMHYATWHSIILAAHNIIETLSIKKKLYDGKRVPSPKHKLSIWPLQYREEVNGWCLYNPFPDEDVMERTQRIKLKNGQRFIQTKSYMQFPNVFLALLFVFVASIIGIITQFKSGVDLLLKYPRFFSLGRMSVKGPTDEELKSSKFKITVVAKGWAQNEEQSGSPNKTKILKITGYNPCYGAAAAVLLHAALTILEEKDKMPNKGGVYSPGIAFPRTTFVERMNRNGIKFEIE